jgi:hypothetical protein
MSDSFLFQSSKNGFQLLVFGTSITDARNYAKNTHPNFDMKFISKNPIVSKYVLCSTTENQVNLNRESLNKLL